MAGPLKFETDISMARIAREVVSHEALARMDCVDVLPAHGLAHDNKTSRISV